VVHLKFNVIVTRKEVILQSNVLSFEMRSEAAVALPVIRRHGEISQTAFEHLETLIYKATLILQKAFVSMENLIYMGKVILQRSAVYLETRIY